MAEPTVEMVQYGTAQPASFCPPLMPHTTQELTVYRPFFWTPDDVLEQILLRVCGEYFGGTGSQTAFTNARRILLIVSPHWKRFIETTGSFWSSYIFKAWAPLVPFEAWTARMIAFPLCINVSLPPVHSGQPDSAGRVTVAEIIRELRSKADKCHTIHISSADSPSYVTLLRGLQSTPFPVLKKLTAFNFSYRPKIIGQVPEMLLTSNLSELRFLGSPHRWYRIGAFQGLTTLVLRRQHDYGGASLRDIYLALKETEFLERLCLDDVQSTSHVEDPSPLILPRLRVFYLDIAGNPHMVQLVSIMQAPALYDLTVAVSSGSDLSCLEHCHSIIGSAVLLRIRASFASWYELSEISDMRRFYAMAKRVTTLDISAVERVSFFDLGAEEAARLLKEEARKKKLEYVGLVYSNGIRLTEEQYGLVERSAEEVDLNVRRWKPWYL
ncbi:hypothetical protein K438DRAFT_1968829 [Mycena galopus ATCC 62051]|nr:hypothetical protein K438DRAFT_1968829 [Mycena galopus ATCC 62051]